MVIEGNYEKVRVYVNCSEEIRKIQNERTMIGESGVFIIYTQSVDFGIMCHSVQGTFLLLHYEMFLRGSKLGEQFCFWRLNLSLGAAKSA